MSSAITSMPNSILDLKACTAASESMRPYAPIMKQTAPPTAPPAGAARTGRADPMRDPAVAGRRRVLARTASHRSMRPGRRGGSRSRPTGPLTASPRRAAMLARRLGLRARCGVRAIAIAKT
ncbi:hypothetical protein PRJ39_10155 [Lysobacter enzymogenes]|uniref:hypothetical protein n=1 Tax=Lysobacter enzymogenes TaxID=69 RepID=UPI003749032D